MKKRNATRKIKTPNYHAVLFAIIIIAMFVAFVHVETSTYAEIVMRRNENAELLKWGTVDMAEIEREAMLCNEEMEKLKNRSPLGKLMVELDKPGNCWNYIIVHGTRVLVMYCIFYIVRDLFRQVRLWINEDGNYSRKNANSKNQSKTLNNQ